MENDLKDFMEKVKDEFKKVRKAIDDVGSTVTTIDGRLMKLEGERKEPDKNEGWF